MQPLLPGVVSVNSGLPERVLIYVIRSRCGTLQRMCDDGEPQRAAFFP